ncbi:hypothetical protein IEQ34_017136 [Dendrobium chrysotoxum]|uniref:Uncharacterized protein n=1 Tax=Dendrobium chrysotoxum TaxID=161865 RepID=A0AAV7GAK4_DENCH|nr:hypothetical protein IEQ34_017136 [Dendrobium chrysotoxum]
MSMRRTYSRVQSFPSPESDTLSPLSNQFDQSCVPKLENLHQLQGSLISAECLSKILDAAIVAQKLGMRLAMDAISPTTGSKSDWKFISCYLDSSVLLLDACNNIQLRLDSIRSCLGSIPIGLHYLEGEHEPSGVVLQRVVESLDFSRFRDKQHCTKIEKSMSRMRTFGKKLSGHTLAYKDTGDIISPELYKALTSSWAMAVLAIRVLTYATSFRPLTNQCAQPPKDERWAMLLNELSNKMKVSPKKANDIASMEELARTEVAAQALLKLISSWQKGANSSLRRMAVKAVAGELRRRKDELDKALPLLEENIGEFYKQIVVLRINMLGLLSKAQREDVFAMVEPFSSEENQMDTNRKQLRSGVAWDIVKRKKIGRSCSLGRIRPHCIGLIKGKILKLSSVNI